MKNTYEYYSDGNDFVYRETEGKVEMYVGEGHWASVDENEWFVNETANTISETQAKNLMRWYDKNKS